MASSDRGGRAEEEHRLERRGMDSVQIRLERLAKCSPWFGKASWKSHIFVLAMHIDVPHHHLVLVIYGAVAALLVSIKGNRLSIHIIFDRAGRLYARVSASLYYNSAFFHDRLLQFFLSLLYHYTAQAGTVGKRLVQARAKSTSLTRRCRRTLGEVVGFIFWRCCSRWG